MKTRIKTQINRHTFILATTQRPLPRIDNSLMLTFPSHRLQATIRRQQREAIFLRKAYRFHNTSQRNLALNPKKRWRRKARGWQFLDGEWQPPNFIRIERRVHCSSSLGLLYYDLQISSQNHERRKNALLPTPNQDILGTFGAIACSARRNQVISGIQSAEMLGDEMVKDQRPSSSAVRTSAPICELPFLIIEH